MSRSANRLVFTGKQQVICEPFTLASPATGEVLVRSICSLMSTGTENIVYNRLFDPGTHWDKWGKYPFYPGYLTIGEVLEVGDDVTSHRPGDRVALRAPHASHHVRLATKCYAVPAISTRRRPRGSDLPRSLSSVREPPAMHSATACSSSAPVRLGKCRCAGRRPWGADTSARPIW